MFRLSRGFLSVALTALLVSLAAGAPPQDPKPEPPESWETVAGKQNLTKAELKLLREQKFVITGLFTRQVFDPYIDSSLPLFITSDSILNAYHVLLEESIYRMELAHSRKLPGALEQFTKHLDATAGKIKGDDALLKAAKKRAAIFLGVARNLLDEKTLPEDADVKTEVQAEVKRIIAASGASKPAWLGAPDDGFLAIDYPRFKPRGFYTLTPGLQRYFWAVAWLQTIPFRLDRDEELAAFFLLRETYFNKDSPPPDQSLWDAFRAFLGDEDDWDLFHRQYLRPGEWTKAGLADVRKEFNEEKRNKSQINDQLRFSPTEAGVKAEVAFRFLSAYRLPEAVMFHRTTEPKELKRDFPSGLEVAAVLGSPFARDKIKKDNPKLLGEIDATRPLFKGKNLYTDYLRCLGTLLERTEPEAPEFLRSEPWSVKSAQTALAGWAQMRHTWVLHAKPQYSSGLALLPIPGFVEPVPEFYGKFATLIEATAKHMERTGAMEAVPEYNAERIEEVRAVQQIVKDAIENKTAINALQSHEQHQIRLWSHATKDKPAAKDLKEVLERLTAYERELQQAKPDERPRPLGGWDIKDNWEALAKVCRRLELLAHKQLRQVPFREDENEFILLYGETLGGIMFYGGNSYHSPRDDAMRVIDVYSNPNAGEHLHVGIARPRIMWVLYPTKNGDVLCRGAVTPYAEFTNPARLTDSEWKSLLDSPKKPEIPAWAAPVIPPERPGK